jgi:hypothetical protein
MLGARDGGKHLKEILATTACSLVAVSAEAGIALKSYQTHTHIVVSVDPDVTYTVARGTTRYGGTGMAWCVLAP